MKIQRFIALSIGILIISLAIKQIASSADTKPTKPIKNVQLLFVQNAAGLSFADGKLTLHNIDPLTICFSDRPERLAGHMPTKDFVPMWSEGQNSFLKDPPNATLSILQGRDASSTVVTLRNPQLSGNDLTYDVTVLEGKIPPSSEACSLFIDVIGCPLTPMSYAGVARRAQPGAEDTGVEVTMVPLFTILPGLTTDPMVTLRGLTGREQRRVGAEIPSPGVATNVVAASLCRGVSDAATAGRPCRGYTAKRGNDGKGAKLVSQ